MVCHDLLEVAIQLGLGNTHSSWVTRRGLNKPISSSSPFKTGLVACTASGSHPRSFAVVRQRHEAFLRILPTPQESTHG
jgi:hypothetical protein